MDIFEKCFAPSLAGELKEKGVYPYFHALQSRQDVEVQMEGKRRIMLGSNNYLGLTTDPEVIEAGIRALEQYGTGCSGSRFLNGTLEMHLELEAELARFLRKPGVVTFGTGFQSNVGIISALVGRHDYVICDRENHASIYAGCQLSYGKMLRYRHSDMAELEKCLQKVPETAGALIVTDGVFSMDGDVAPLKEICDLADKYNALVWIDESHSAGFFGKTGRGTPEYCGVQGRIDFINSTMGKAMGGASGGYTCASKEVVTLLRQKSRPYLFSNTLAPSLVGAAIKTYTMLMESSTLPEKVLANTHLFRDRMTAAGFKLAGAYDHPICPVMLGDAALACKFADKMLEKGIYVIGFSYPVVPQGKARIRTQMSGAHTLEQVNRCVDAFIEVGKELGVIA